jgi:hypothetical protein
VPDEDEDTTLACLGANRLRERGLADPCLATDEHEAAAARDGGGERVTQQLLLPLAADEGGGVAA